MAQAFLEFYGCEDETSSSASSAADSPPSSISSTSTLEIPKPIAASAISIFETPASRPASSTSTLEIPPSRPASSTSTLEMPTSGPASSRTSTPAVSPPQLESDEPLPTPIRPSGATADWDEFLKKVDHLTFIAPVETFKNAPLSRIWSDIAKVGLIIEAPNIHVMCEKPVYWFAKVKYFAGYFALIVYEDLGVNIEKKRIGWMSFCTQVPKPIGYCERNRILMYPGRVIAEKFDNTPYRVAKEMFKGHPTVRDNHAQIIDKELVRCENKAYALWTLVEVPDTDENERILLGKVTKRHADRIYITFLTIASADGFVKMSICNNDSEEQGYWFNDKSENIHPLGWCQAIGLAYTSGQTFDTPRHLKNKCFVPESLGERLLGADDFPKYPEELVLEVGQFLECRHPCMHWKMCVVRISILYKYGYFEVEVKTEPSELAIPEACIFHVTSPYIYPLGFCKKMKIKVLPRFECDDPIPLPAAPLHLLPPRPPHKFKVNMKMEAVSENFPTYIGPATIRRVKGHMLYLSHDGWPRNEVNPPEFWVDADSPDLYPAGYCQLTGLTFNGCVEHPSVRAADFKK